jgi:hypothetical protein
MIVVVFLAFIAVMGATWAPWGMKQADWRSEKHDSNSNKTKIIQIQKSAIVV